MDARVTGAFTPVFDGPCPRMTSQCLPPLVWYRRPSGHDPSASSWPGLFRPAASLIWVRKQGVDARRKAGHDEAGSVAVGMSRASPRSALGARRSPGRQSIAGPSRPFAALAPGCGDCRARSRSARLRTRQVNRRG